MTTLLNFKGTKVPALDLGKLTPGEADAVERVTGLTFQKIRRLGDLCVCDHGSLAHQREDETDTSCGEDGCRCGEFEADMPAIVATALTWVAVKRALPTIKFSEVSETPYSDMEIEEVDDAADPTEPPPEAA